MQAGKLDRRVTLMPAIEGATNAFGEPTKLWAEGKTVWCEKLNVSDAERVKAAAAGIAITVRLQIRWTRYAAALTSAARVRFEGQTYELSGQPKELGRREGLELTAARVDEAKA